MARTKKKGKGQPPISKRWDKMSRAEQERFVREYEYALDSKSFEPPTPREQAKLDRVMNRVRRRPGRPRIGEGAERVLITIERGLLRSADAFARKNNMSRAQLIAEGLRGLLAGGLIIHRRTA